MYTHRYVYKHYVQTYICIILFTHLQMYIIINVHNTYIINTYTNRYVYKHKYYYVQTQYIFIYIPS